MIDTHPTSRVTTTADLGSLVEREAELDVARVYAGYANFVWASLHRLGVRDADRQDLLQEVFLVVHKRLHAFEGRSKLRTWLYGICIRVVTAHRRRAYVRRERPMAEPPEPARATSGGDSPEADAMRKQATQRLEAMLDEMDLEKRAVFVMFEIDELPADEIATILGAPVGTVHSRLFAARRQFTQIVGRQNARDASGARR